MVEVKIKNGQRVEEFSSEQAIVATDDSIFVSGSPSFVASSAGSLLKSLKKRIPHELFDFVLAQIFIAVIDGEPDREINMEEKAESGIMAYLSNLEREHGGA